MNTCEQFYKMLNKIHCCHPEATTLIHQGTFVGTQLFKMFDVREGGNLLAAFDTLQNYNFQSNINKY